MLPRPAHMLATTVSVTLVLAPFAAALAVTAPAAHASARMAVLPETSCGGEYGSATNITINKPVDIYKPVTINKNINVFKPTVINKNIEIDKSVTVNKSIDITKTIDASKTINIYKPVTINKTIDASKNIEINKNVIINKGSSADASAMASAMAVAVATAVASASASASVNNQISINLGDVSASANARAGVAAIIYGGSSYENITVNNYGSLGKLDVSVPKTCVYQDATVVKAVHAICVSAEGREFAASHMLSSTWIDSTFEGEVARCIAGSTLKITIGQVVQSDQGLAATYGKGQILQCNAGEALRHYKDGLLKCAPAVAVPDCTERTNLRLYGTGDFFFSFRTRVCAEIFQSAAESDQGYGREQESRDLEIENLSLSGGVGSGY